MELVFPLVGRKSPTSALMIWLILILCVPILPRGFAGSEPGGGVCPGREISFGCGTAAGAGLQFERDRDEENGAAAVAAAFLR